MLSSALALSLSANRHVPINRSSTLAESGGERGFFEIDATSRQKTSGKQDELEATHD